MLERAGAHGLAYLADVDPNLMFVANYGDKVAEPLLKECGHSQVLLEQYLDFVVNRTFRQSLLVHAERAQQIRYQLDRWRYGRLHFAAWLPPAGGETRLDDSRRTTVRRVGRRCSRTIRASRRRWMHSMPAGRGHCHGRSCWMRCKRGLVPLVSKPPPTRRRASTTCWSF
jgi:hypothetical protein